MESSAKIKPVIVTTQVRFCFGLVSKIMQVAASCTIQCYRALRVFAVTETGRGPPCWCVEDDLILFETLAYAGVGKTEEMSVVVTEEDHAAFLQWLQCYNNPDMSVMKDKNGRTIWFQVREYKIKIQSLCLQVTHVIHVQNACVN